MINTSDILMVSIPLIIIGAFGVLFCFIRDFKNIKNQVSREKNTAPEIYWFLVVLIIVGLFLGFNWKTASLITLAVIFGLHPLRKKTKFIRESKPE